MWRCTKNSAGTMCWRLADLLADARHRAPTTELLAVGALGLVAGFDTAQVIAERLRGGRRVGDLVVVSEAAVPPAGRAAAASRLSR